MRFSFNPFGDTYEVTFKIYNEDKLVQSQTTQAPEEIIKMNFIQLVDQIGPDKRPMKMVMSRPETIWDNFENREKILDIWTSFSNNAYITWEERK